MDFQSFSKMANSLSMKKKKDDKTSNKGSQPMQSVNSFVNSIVNPQNSSSASNKLNADQSVPFELISSTSTPIHTALLSLKSKVMKIKESDKANSSNTTNDGGFDINSKGIVIKWYRLLKNGKYVDIYPNEANNQANYQLSIFDVGCSIVILVANLDQKSVSTDDYLIKLSDLDDASIINYIQYGPILLDQIVEETSSAFLSMMEDQLLFNGVDNESKNFYEIRLDIENRNKIKSINVIAESKESSWESIKEFCIRPAEKLSSNAIMIERKPFDSNDKDNFKIVEFQSSKVRDSMVRCIEKLGGKIEDMVNQIEIPSLPKSKGQFSLSRSTTPLNDENRSSGPSPAKKNNPIVDFQDAAQIFKPLTEGVNKMTKKLQNNFSASLDKKNTSDDEYDGENGDFDDEESQNTETDEKEKEILLLKERVKMLEESLLSKPVGSASESELQERLKMKEAELKYIIDKHESNISELRSEWEQALVSLKSELAKKDNEIASQKEEMKRLKSLSSAAETGKALAQVQSLQKKFEVVESEKKQLESVLSESETKIKSLESKVNSLEQENAEIIVLKQDINRIQELFDSSSKREDDLQNQRQNLLEKVSEREEQLQHLKNSNYDQEKELNEMRSNFAKVEEEKIRFENETERLMALNNSISKKSESLSKDLSKIMNAAASAASTSIVSVPVIESMFKDLVNAKQELEQLRSSKVSGATTSPSIFSSRRSGIEKIETSSTQRRPSISSAGSGRNSVHTDSGDVAEEQESAPGEGSTKSVAAASTTSSTLDSVRNKFIISASTSNQLDNSSTPSFFSVGRKKIKSNQQQNQQQQTVELQKLANSLMETLNEKDILLEHQRQANKMIAKRVQELEQIIRELKGETNESNDKKEDTIE